MPFDDEPEQVDPGPLLESENLESVSLSPYDCDSGNDADSEDSDGGARGAQKPRMMNLQFQLDAAKAGECYGFHLIDPTVNCIT